jgi:hypothetical protein
MSENTKKVEQHGCIVCGKIHTLLVIYTADGRFVDCTVTSPGGRRLPDETRPLVACESHSQSQIDLALKRHYPGKPEEDDKDDR